MHIFLLPLCMADIFSDIKKKDAFRNSLARSQIKVVV